MIALTYSSYQPESICSACGSSITKYVDHCILWCHENANIRHMMWVGFWHKYGIDLYIRLAELTNDVWGARWLSGRASDSFSGIRNLPPPCCVLEQDTLLPESTGKTLEAVAPSQ